MDENLIEEIDPLVDAESDEEELYEHYKFIADPGQ
jgi:hypothetical protein